MNRFFFKVCGEVFCSNRLRKESPVSTLHNRSSGREEFTNLCVTNVVLFPRVVIGRVFLVFCNSKCRLDHQRSASQHAEAKITERLTDGVCEPHDTRLLQVSYHILTQAGEHKFSFCAYLLECTLKAHINTAVHGQVYDLNSHPSCAS